MRHTPGSAALLALATLAASLIGAGCRRRPAPMPAPAPLLDEEYCWWAVLRTALPPDSVAARFERAFTEVGLTGAARASRADTAWAHAGPTLLRGEAAGLYESRAVAYRRGDSTHFRYFVAAARPRPEDRAQPADPAERGPSPVGFCGQIARTAAIPTSVPPSPTGEEALPVWTRRP